jgi:hypothetical protein
LSVQVPPELEECGLSKVTSASQGGQLAGASYQAGSTVRDQPELFGRIASTPTAWRVIERAAKDPDGLARLRAARAHARARAWAAGGHPDVELLVIDADATLVLAHSDAKQGVPARDARHKATRPPASP